MDIRSIQNEADHRAVLVEIERLWSALPGTAEADKLDELAALVELFEDRHYPVGTPVLVQPYHVK